MGIKDSSDELPIFFAVRGLYYAVVEKLADTKTIQNFTGLDIYERVIIN